MHDIILFIQHHMLLSMALAATLVLLIILEFIKIKKGARTLSPSQAIQYINHHKAAVIDIRSYETYLTGHIINSISLPLNEINNKLKKIEKFKTQPLIIACATGSESQRAEKLLTEKGFTSLILSGGIRAWREADMPLLKG